MDCEAILKAGLLQVSLKFDRVWSLPWELEEGRNIK